MLAKIDIEDSQSICRRGGNELLNRVARSLTALSEAATTNSIGVASGFEGPGAGGQVIRRDIVLDGEMGRPSPVRLTVAVPVGATASTCTVLRGKAIAWKRRMISWPRSSFPMRVTTWLFAPKACA